MEPVCQVSWRSQKNFKQMKGLYKYFYYSALFILLGNCTLQAQSLKAYKKAAVTALQQKDYQAAFYYYDQAIQIAPDDMGLWYQYATMALRFNAFNEAKKAYQKVYESKILDNYPLTSYQLGLVNNQLGEYGEAIAYYQQYLNSGHTEIKKEKVERAIAACQWANTASHPSSLWQVEHLDRKVNTPYSEFAPVKSGDTLYYTSFKFDMEEDEHDPIRKISKVMFQRGKGRGRTITRGFNDDKQHTAHITFANRGAMVIYTRCQYINATEIQCQLYTRVKDKRGRWSKKEKKLPGHINLDGYTTTQPSIGYDSILQTEMLYFVSDRPEGTGGLDIWTAVIKGDSLGQATPLNTINTEEDEITPFFHNQSQHLYFSSNGYRGFGGYDIYKLPNNAKRNEVEHLPAPLNTSYNDVYLSMNKDGESGYFASNRPGSKLLDADKQACCNDIYYFEYQPPAPPEEEVVIEEPKTPVEEITPEPPSINNPPDKLEDFLPLALYFDNDEPDKRTRKTSTKKTYEATYRAYMARIDEYEKAFAEPLSDDRRDEALDAIGAFFESDVEKGFVWLGKFSEILLKRLEKGEAVEIFLKGYTSPRAKKEYNLALSKRRISSVRNQFRTYKNGVFVSYLESGHLIISERPFGEAEASSQVSDALEDLRNSIYHPDAARERRVEIVEVKGEK